MRFSDIMALVALVVSIFSIILGIERDANSHFINMFNEIYYQTFSLRGKISKLTQQTEEHEFFYELDSIISNAEVEEAILDYLTEMANFFSYVCGHYIARKSFKNLVSLAFYQRTMALLPYIKYKRNKINNSKFLINYVKALEMMSKMEKTTSNNNSSLMKCYIGLRYSDKQIAGQYFQEAICLFSSEDQVRPFSIRLNPNIGNKNILPYYFSKVYQLHALHPECQFVFYNQAMAYNFPSYILKKSLFINSAEILNFLNNKLSIRKWFVQSGIPTLPYETFYGRDILYSKVSSHFQDADTFVIQSPHGGGGIGTFLINQSQFSEVPKFIHPMQQYLVSPYINHSVSVNTHVFIAEKQTVLSPGSIQISELRQHQICYRGADFIEFYGLPSKIKNRVKQLSLEIANLLRKEHYRGIAGIDFVLDEKGEIYCLEINPRFQASTYLIDLFLSNNAHSNAEEATSCFELNEMAFNGSINSQLCFEDRINYSCYNYYCDGIDGISFTKLQQILEDGGAEVLPDGLKPYLPDHLDNNSYLFKAIFSHAICKISPDTTLWVNDNIRLNSKPKDALELKIALLNQGIRLTGACDGIKSGVFNSIDIEIEPCNLTAKKILANCAVETNLAQYSPYEIRCPVESVKLPELFYYDEKIADVTLEKNKLCNLSAQYQNVLYLATDRLRIKLISGCEYKNIGKGCKFCNLPVSNDKDDKTLLENIIKALKQLKDESTKDESITFRHILIGGGTSLSPHIWEDTITLCERLKGDDYYRDKPITLMSILPPQEMLQKLKLAGVDEVAFNLEIADEELALQMMPGKRQDGKNAYYETFQAAVKIFGVGKVRPTLLVGFDKSADILRESLTLANMGVMPCLSVFRGLPESELEGSLTPSNYYLRTIYDSVENVLLNLEGDIHEVGPPCVACKNNMLAL